MRIYNALNLKNGATVDKRSSGGVLSQPIQFLPDKEKTEGWAADCIDWFEQQGAKQIRRNSKRLLKNYKLAKGIIDKSDYIVDDDNDNAELIDVLTKEDESALELKFYPIIPNVVNVLCSEFSKRTSKIMFRAVDDISYNEMLEEKRAMIEEVLIFQAQQKQQIKLMNMGLSPEDPEAQQMMAPEAIRSLPEIEGFFRKNYRSLAEEWATHQMKVDVQRFRMKELEEQGFRDSLITDREFWHFRMMEDDYEVELWNPLTTFYHKSPDVRYVSQGNYVGKIDLHTPADVIDKYGWMMTKEQLDTLERVYPIRDSRYSLTGLQNDGSFYDPTRSHEWNVEGPSLAMRQFNSFFDVNFGTGDIIDRIMSDSEDFLDFGYNLSMLRVTTLYWKSQRMIGHLTKILDNGEVIQDIVTEDYKITEKPIYNTTFYKNKTKENLIYGEHIDWIWINEVYGGIKIGPNGPTSWVRNTDGSGFDPVYLGIRGGKPGRIPFQFKGDNNLYGCKLPVEGSVFSDRNTRSVALVDIMKPYQIGYNVVNNQIADILVDELGTVIMLDQNALPRHSMGEDWGKNNLAKAYVAMKNFQMLPFDTTITNTENALNFQHYTVLNLEQTNRLVSRINLANYFKSQAFEVIGINPQRLGQELSQSTATGVEQAVQASYAQTEIYFIQHCDHLMPRVHQMRTDLAQFYNSTKPSLRLQYVTQADEKVNFQINGTQLLLRDINVECTTDANTRNIMEQLRALAINNNTTGASIYDIGNMIKAESVAELTKVLKESEDKQRAIREQEMAHEQELNKQNIEAAERERLQALQFEAEENERDRQKDILVAEIKATTAIGVNKADMDRNNQNDQIDAMNQIQEQQNYQEQMNFEREKEINKNSHNQQKINLDREKLQTQKDIAQKQVDIARINKNKYDKPSSTKKK
jgi:hypothetical protein